MKKSILILLTLLPLLSSAQTFKLTPTGFVNSIDTTKNFIVINQDDKTGADLYKMSLVYFTSMYVSPNDVISKVDNEAITINGVKKGAVRQNGTATPFNMNYTLVFQFKDGRIRINEPTFRLTVGLRTMYLVYTGFSMNGQEAGIYGKGGKVKSEKAIVDLEKFFADYIEKYKNSLSSKSDW